MRHEAPSAGCVYLDDKKLLAIIMIQDETVHIDVKAETLKRWIRRYA